MIFCAIPAALFAAELLLRTRIRKKMADGSRAQGQDTEDGSGSPVRIVPAENRGFAGNRLENRPKCVKAVSAASLAACALMYPFVLLHGKSALLKAGVSLLFGGAAGNTFERIRYGYVTDYLQFSGRRKRGGRRRGMIWNAADLAILAGAAMMIIGLFREK